MSLRKRTALVLLIGLGAVLSLVMWSNLHACKWNTEAGHGVSRASASPRSFGPSAYPEGDFVVTVEAPTGLQKALLRYLERELPKTAFGASRIIVVSDASSYVPGELAPAESNMLYVHIEASLIWTPFYSRFNDATVVKFTNRYAPDWAGFPEEPIEITDGALRLKGEYSATGRGFGLIGRSYADTYHAELIGEFIKQAIVDAYAQIREEAAKPLSH